MYDTKPRKVDAHTAQIVCNLAELAVRELERDWAVEVSPPAPLHSCSIYGLKRCVPLLWLLLQVPILDMLSALILY